MTGAATASRPIPGAAAPPPAGEDALREHGGGGRVHLAHVDGLRALAALYVLCVHLLSRAWGRHVPGSLLLRLIAKVTSEGHFAVTAFIVISGFCLMLPVVRAGGTLRGGARVFFVRRFWRIAPPMYLAVLLSVLLLQIPSLRAAYGYSQVNARQLVAHGLLVQTFVPYSLLPNDGPLWSISVECLMYVFFPLMVFSGRRFGMIATAAAYVVAGYALAFAARGTVFTLETWQYLGAFALGALAADVSYGATAARPGVKRVPWHLLAAGCLAIIDGVIAACGWPLVDRHVAAFDLPMALATMAVLIATSRSGPGILRRILQWRPLAVVGLFSYSLYIIHYPLADLLCQVIVAPIHNELAREAVLAGVVAPALIALAYGFYRLFEQPFHRLARRIGRPPKTDRIASAAVPSH